MKTQLILFTFTLSLLVGCSTNSTTHYVPRDPLNKDLADAIGGMKGNTVTFTTTGGNAVRWDSLSVRSDTLVGYDHTTHAPFRIRLSNVDEVAVTNGIRGMRRGVVRGLFVGVLPAVIASSKLMGSRPPDDAVRDATTTYVVCVLACGLIGTAFLSTDHYRFTELERYQIWKDQHTAPGEARPELKGLSPSETITLTSWPMHDERPESICILWDGKPLWLPKSRIKFERLADGKISLTIPKELLETHQEK